MRIKRGGKFAQGRGQVKPPHKGSAERNAKDRTTLKKGGALSMRKEGAYGYIFVGKDFVGGGAVADHSMG